MSTRAKRGKNGKNGRNGGGRQSTTRSSSSTAPRRAARHGNGHKAKVRYAVVGLGYISQIAVLPAFAHAKGNSELVALVSGNDRKLRELSKKYKVPLTYNYDDLDRCLRSGDIDAVYIALPNDLHAEYTIRAARAGVHVLCEKPMAVTEAECREMIAACDDNDVKLMIAYRLHFEAATLEAIEAVRSGKIGKVRAFNSLFSMQVKEPNIRLEPNGGGTLYDIGIYCINAVRALFGAEPEEVFATSVQGTDPRFEEVDEMTSAVLRFPGDRLATFTSSFGASDVSTYTVLGTKGSLCVDSAYELAEGLSHYLTIDGRTRTRQFSKRDQFGPELFYFSSCIQEDREPEPGGQEGLNDVRIIRALYSSARRGEPLELEPLDPVQRPTRQQRIDRPPVRERELVEAQAPSE